MKKSLSIALLMLCLAFTSAYSVADQQKKDHKPSAQKKEPLSRVEKAAEKLVEQFLDTKNKNLSWKCFSQAMADLSRKDKKYSDLAKIFDSLSTATNGIVIGLTLQKHTDSLPAHAKKRFEKKTVTDLSTILEMRIGLNKKVSCNSKMIVEELLDEEKDEL